MPYDERPLPALQRKDRPVEAIQTPAELHSPHADAQRTPQSPELSGEPEPLTEKAQREAGLPVEVYGESVVRKNILSQEFLFHIPTPQILFGTS